MEKMVSPCRFCNQKKDRKICSKNCKPLKKYCKKIGNPSEFLKMGINYEEVYCSNLSNFHSLKF